MAQAGATPNRREILYVKDTATGLPVPLTSTLGLLDVSGGGGGDVNLTEIGGTAVAVNSGAKSNGTIRVVIATDQPQLTNGLLSDTRDGAGNVITSAASGSNRGLHNIIVDGSGNNLGSLGILGEGNTFADTIKGILVYGREAGSGAAAIAHSLVTDSAGKILESNSAAIAASASVLDDWDESDRAKVNPIVGQAGVAGGAGTTGATTQRVVLATDTTVPVTSVVPGTAATNLGKAEDAGHTTGDTGVMALGVRADAGATGNPTALATTSLDYIPFATDANNRVYVNVAGDLAHDAADSTSNPIKVGGQARTTNPTAVADADRVNFIADKLGKQVVVGSIRDLKRNQVTTITSSTSETTIASAVASTFLDLYGLIVTNTSATAVNVAIKDSTAGTTRLNIAVPAGETRGFMLPESAAIKQATVNNNWTATCSGSVASVIITALTVDNI